jgi:hypothetical protein
MNVTLLTGPGPVIPRLVTDDRAMAFPPTRGSAGPIGLHGTRPRFVTRAVVH